MNNDEQARSSTTDQHTDAAAPTDTEGHMIAEYEDAYGWKGKIGTGGESLVQPTGRDIADVGARIGSNVKWLVGEIGQALPPSPF
jgi:hypothetical protein